MKRKKKNIYRLSHFRTKRDKRSKREGTKIDDKALLLQIKIKEMRIKRIKFKRESGFGILGSMIRGLIIFIEVRKNGSLSSNKKALKE